MTTNHMPDPMEKQETNPNDRPRLTTDMISEPSLWRLSMELTDRSLEVLLYCTLEGQSLIHRSIPLDTAVDRLKAFEDVIYDNPLLLAEFGKIDLLVDTRKFMSIPSDIRDETTVDEMLNTMWPDSNNAFVANTLPVPGCRFITCLDKGLLTFIRRTFPAVKVMHPLSTLITYFYNKDRFSNSSRIYVHLQQGRIDIIYYYEGRLIVVNTFDTPTVDDMIYYILAVARHAEFSLDEDEIMLCGTPAIREQLAPALRKYAKYVMPVVFPSAMYHAGKDALEAPFELILLPLCV